MSMEGPPDNDNDIGNGFDLEELKEELGGTLEKIEATLRDLGMMSESVGEEINSITEHLERLREQLARLDDKAMQMWEAGQLDENSQLPRAVAQTMNGLDEMIQYFLKEQEISMETRMTLEQAIEDLEEEREKLLAREGRNKRTQH